jgi:hypothetical protein
MSTATGAQASPPGTVPPLNSLSSAAGSGDGPPLSTRKASVPRGKSSSSTSSRLRGLYGWGSSNTGQLGMCRACKHSPQVKIRALTDIVPSIGSGAEAKERLVPASIWGFEKAAMFDCAGSHSIVVKRMFKTILLCEIFAPSSAQPHPVIFSPLWRSMECFLTPASVLSEKV